MLLLLINTHKIIANNLLNIASGKKLYLIDSRRFIWGNIKPDCVSKYKFKKHYYNESIDMIVKKIEELSRLSISTIYFEYGKGKFSEELGVICHFLCDYFCLPHNQRWEFKNSMKKHISYENQLAKFIKQVNITNYINDDLRIKDIKGFIDINLKKYEKNTGYINDLSYSYYICNSVINTILNVVVMNEYKNDKIVG